MIKIVVIILGVLLVGVTVYFGFFHEKALFRSDPVESSSTATQSAVPKVSSSAATLKSVPTASSAALLDRVTNLEIAVADIKKQLGNKTVTTPSAPAANKAPTYVPLGSGGVATTLDWSTIDTYEITLNPADYPGYTSVQLEVSLRVFQGNGQAFARLFNNTDQLAILKSEVSTTSQDYTWVSSPGFQLFSGSKAYRIQLRSLTGYEASIANARLKINF